VIVSSMYFPWLKEGITIDISGRSFGGIELGWLNQIGISAG
jgi:hypothetical protein